MVRTSTVAIALAASLAATAPALAEGRYGGGFIEFLMTGNAGGASRAPQAVRSVPAAPAAHQSVYARPPYAAAPQPVPRAAMPVYATAPGAEPLLEDNPYRQAPAAPRLQRASLSVPAPMPAVHGFDSRYERQSVDYGGGHRPGTVVIDTPSKYLYLVQENGKALRYGIGVGRPGFEWAGVKSITRKAEWPDWTPPAEMLKRRPDLPRFMKGGEDNPLGARALYLGSSLYRIHGTNEPSTIGQAVSSGCIRMRNQDVIDLYERVRVGAKVIVI